ncbi:PA2169 family four-helix-bundle protein [Mucilaginibacter robiniae]|uniref:PA2169 family four-helix-bundle protein n=1 Tax=Mucilaginibacter robiniae TaxID=2728022 RepID=A0A7L5DU18_9SPHI|nr:PA2169 family four-helix-bundle protein [Mucilaginibacter robiniae]QJD94605.1 PA2169 family four-helix-bundle protein [Mucilaginibacter robiniae]
MATSEKSVEVLNDLLEINNDRIKGFERSISELGNGDSDLKSLFEEYSSQSRKNVQELTAAVTQSGGSAETGNSISGTIHRAWIDVKGTFTGHDRKSILQECERGEDAMKSAYKSALAPDSELSADLVQTVSKQAEEQKLAHDRVKALRDSE